MKILLTAFEPFAGERVNPAMEAAALLGDSVAGAKLVCISVPVVFGKSVDVVTAAIRREKPDAVLCIGQAGGRFELTPERVAINMDDARIPDEEGNQPQGHGLSHSRKGHPCLRLQHGRHFCLQPSDVRGAFLSL